MLRWGDWHLGVARWMVAGIHYRPHFNSMTSGPARPGPAGPGPLASPPTEARLQPEPVQPCVMWGKAAALLFNPNSNGLVKKAATFYYLSGKPRYGESSREQIKRQETQAPPFLPLPSCLPCSPYLTHT